MTSCIDHSEHGVLVECDNPDEDLIHTPGYLLGWNKPNYPVPAIRYEVWFDVVSWLLGQKKLETIIVQEVEAWEFKQVFPK